MKLKEITDPDVNVGARGNPRSKKRRNPESGPSVYKRPAAVQARADEKRRAAVYKRPAAVKARIAAGSHKAFRDRWEEAEEIERLRKEAQGKDAPNWWGLAAAAAAAVVLVVVTRPTAPA